MRFFTSLRAVMAVALLASSFALVTTDFAEARRGGSFGSRGFRTFNRPAPTQTAPRTANPIDRSMTPRQQSQPGATNAGSRAAAGTRQQNRGGLFGGLGGGLLGGLMLGGLIGMMMGNGLGGMAGLLGLIVQVGLAVLVVSLIMRWFRSRQQPAYAGPADSPAAQDTGRTAYAAAESAPRAKSDVRGGGSAGAGLGGSAPGTAPGAGADEIGITAEDYDAFEQLLVEVQAAFSREDYASLRRRCTPEIVSFLSEELSQNAVNGRKNDVTDVRLLEGDLSEAWREDQREYATVAMRFESVDVMRDRQTGEIVEGNPHASETTEVWTFVRPTGGEWQLSAIQEA